jgi:segregation and condensation protein B
MVLDPKLVDFQKEFFGRNRQIRLSQAAIDVMAIVAYNQPVTREQVDKIRARPSGSVLNQLVRRQLLFVEPGETDSKIKYFATTDRFLDLFQLEEIADLPQSHDVSDMDELAD